MPSFSRPGSSVIDYNAVTGDSVTTAAQKQDIALNDLYTNIVDGTAAVKGIVQLGTTASTAALGNHLHTGIYQPAGSYAASGANSDITSLSGITTPLSVAQGGTGGTTALGTAAYVDTGTGVGDVPVLNADSLIPSALFSESGTFTPTVAGTTAAGTGTYSNQFASYIRIGNLVYIALYIVWSAHTGTGDMKITGLPFPSAATTNVNLVIGSLTITGVPVGKLATDSSEVSVYSMNNGTLAALAIDSTAAIICNFVMKI